MMRFLFLTRQYLEVTMLWMGIRDTRGIGCSSAVRYEYLVSRRVSEHSDAMCALFLGEAMLGFYVRTIKEVHCDWLLVIGDW